MIIVFYVSSVENRGFPLTLIAKTASPGPDVSIPSLGPTKNQEKTKEHQGFSVFLFFLFFCLEYIDSKNLVFLRFRVVLDGLESSGRPVGRIST